MDNKSSKDEEARGSAGPTREEKRAAALRGNLRKRKQQAKARDEDEETKE